ncbi:class I SAM-dependent DNA methyltransferase [Sulfurospirillum diekertiae]|nr:DNA methyltransferase [Sulfurospirillum diekertiae]
MAKLYDELQKNNEFKTKEEIHALNVFLTRLLFCYFAEDTNIFPDNLFTSSLSSHTQIDGSDLDAYLQRLFTIFNTPNTKREPNTPAYLNAFPYVNGGLFALHVKLPTFTTRSRSLMLEIGQLKWSQINPDIFGSMIQAVVTPEHRGGMGMHYTSVPNIMKVIEPLFLDELYVEFEKSYESKTKLKALRVRLSKLKIFDPACGSGNFLIIAYKKLRELEMSILQRIDSLSRERSFVFSEIKLTQFYGIELDDFAHEVALLSLWLAEHQMNLEFYKAFGRTSPSLPLQDGGNIVHGNATRLNWEEVCPKNGGDEIYILGNPPYLGFRNWDNKQKEEMELVFSELGNVKRLDYISCWFKKATDFIYKINSKYSFVSTNSISQGEQVSLIWPYIFDSEQEISFAHQSFKWQNNAKDNAGVTVVIIGIRNKSDNKKYLYQNMIKKVVYNINPYLLEGSNIYIKQRNTPISNFPEMALGSSSIDGGFLILSPEERCEFIQADSNSEKFIKKYIGGNDFLNGLTRYCLWIEDSQVEEANKITKIKERIEKCKDYRLSAGRDAKKAAATPHRFFYRKYKEEISMILPFTSSENRDYLPVGFEKEGTIISNGLFVIYDSSIFIFGVLSSKLHNLWTKVVSGKLESRIRYSVNLVYNNFPFPNISQKQKNEITELVFGVLDEREKHSQKTLAQLYDPDKMPEGLRKAHHALDKAIEQCYRPKPFESDEERLEYLFKMYEEMVSIERKKK